MANSCKFYKQQKQVSMNSGATWDNVVPFEYRRGDLLERDSEDCREGTLISRWLTIPDAFICEGRNKYEKMVGQYSLDNGSTWDYYNPSIYQKGLLLETNSEICHNKWEGHYFANVDGLCQSGYRYVPGRGCVYTGQPKDPVKYVRCASSDPTTLTSADTRYNPYYLFEGIVGDCVRIIDNNAFVSNTTYLSSITISDGVTVIRGDAFSYLHNLREVRLPSNYVTIEGYWKGTQTLRRDVGAFMGCDALTGITINAGDIQDNAFNGCTSLSSLTFGSGEITIGRGTFSGCTSLKSVTIPSNVTSNGSFNFQNAETINTNTKVVGQSFTDAQFDNTHLKNLIIGDNTETIGNWAFDGFNTLTNVTIGTGVTSIGEDAFRFCNALTSVTINAITPPTLGDTAFYSTNNCPIFVPCQSVVQYKAASGWREYNSRIFGIPPCDEPIPPEEIKWVATYLDSHTETGVCDGSSVITSGEVTSKSAVTRIELGECVTSIGAKFFYQCPSLISVSIPDTVTSIGYSAFTSCSALTSINIPDGITIIDTNTFAGCYSLSSITIPDSVTSIGYGAFSNCSGMTSVTIGSGITSIGNYAFYDCNSLTGITIEAVTPPTIPYRSATFASSTCPIYVPAQSVEAYKAGNWSSYADRIQPIT